MSLFGTMLLTEYNESEHEEFVFNAGQKVGMATAIKNMMVKLKLAFEETASVLKIPANEYDSYRQAVSRFTINCHSSCAFRQMDVHTYEYGHT